MDRYDEAKHVHTDDDRDAGTMGPEGDVLGITHAPVPKSPGDPTASDDPESVRRRRQRALGEDEGRLSDQPSSSSGPGATGIDMGYGGQGTDIKER